MRHPLITLSLFHSGLNRSLLALFPNFGCFAPDPICWAGLSPAEFVAQVPGNQPAKLFWHQYFRL
jgi:hypothetical protein